jgi:hypothetical protein
MVDGVSDEFQVQGGAVYTFNALNMRCWRIDVYKFEDANSNGVYDLGTDPLVTSPSFTFQLQMWDGAKWINVGSEKTTRCGMVTFWGCDAGLYRVIEILDDDSNCGI